MQLINRTGGGGEKKITVYKTSSETHKKQSEELKVVGVYVNVDTERVAPGSYYRFMMSDALMNKLNIYTEQGDFVRFLFNPSASRSGTKIFINQMLNQEGLTLVWYGNSALEIIRLNEELIKQGADLFLYIALVLAAFSIFMLFNYIATSIVNKRQTIGVLRGLGSGSRDVLRMFLCESIIIALINAVLATVIAAVGCVFVNSYILNVMNVSIPFAIFGIRQGLIIFALSFVTAIASSALPIFKITREKPVDLIRRP
jgi:ABC-type antimicrobial peptide transport system permease subunit